MSLPLTFTNSLGELQILDANDYIGNMPGYLEKHEEYRVECSRKITVGIDQFELTEDEKLYTSILIDKQKEKEKEQQRQSQSENKHQIM